MTASRTCEKLAPLALLYEDFEAAVRKVQPSSTREGFATVPNVGWGDIGALGAVREELELSILRPIDDPDRFKALGLSMPVGVLLFGTEKSRAPQGQQGFANVFLLQELEQPSAASMRGSPRRA